MPKRAHATNQEFSNRVDQTAILLGSMLTDGQVRAKLKEEHGISRSQCDRYLAKARELIRKRSGRSRFEHLCEADGFYRSEIARSTDPVIRIKCRERLDALYGVDAKFENGPAQPPGITNNTLNISISVAGLSVDQIEQLVEQGRQIDVRQLGHIDTADRLRILRKCANQSPDGELSDN